MTDFYYDVLARDGEDFYSEVFDYIAYNRENQQVYVEFKSGGEYVYDDVTESTFNLWVSAASLGRFYREHIQGDFVSSHFDGYVYKNEPESVTDGVTTGDEESSPVEETSPAANFGVKLRLANAIIEVGYRAADEADALNQFYASASATYGLNINNYSIITVTHYFG